MSIHDKFRQLGESLGRFGLHEINDILSGIADNDPDAMLEWVRTNCTTELQTIEERDDTVIIWKATI